MSATGRIQPPLLDGSPWLRRYRPYGQLLARLVCFPHAGGGPSVFGGWDPLLPDGVELVAVHLPGRETRIREPAPEDLAALLDEVAAALDFDDKLAPTLFGHSWGAILAFELARRLGPAVGHLVVSGARAPHLPSPLPVIADLPRAELLAELGRYDGIHPEILAHDDYLDVVLPTLRADLRMAEHYQLADAPGLTCPITAFGGRDDPMTGQHSLAAWSRYTQGECEVRLFDGGHFFYVDDPEPVVAAISLILAGGGAPS